MFSIKKRKDIGMLEIRGQPFALSLKIPPEIARLVQFSACVPQILVQENTLVCVTAAHCVSTFL